MNVRYGHHPERVPCYNENTNQEFQNSPRKYFTFEEIAAPDSEMQQSLWEKTKLRFLFCPGKDFSAVPVQFNTHRTASAHI